MKYKSPEIIIRLIVRTKVEDRNGRKILKLWKMNNDEKRSCELQKRKWKYVILKDFKAEDWMFYKLNKKALAFMLRKKDLLDEFGNNWQKQISYIAYNEKHKLPGLILESDDIKIIGRCKFRIDVDWY